MRRGVRSRALLSEDVLATVAASRRLAPAERLLALVGKGEITAAAVVNALLPEPDNTSSRLPRKVTDYTPYVAVSGASGLEVRIAACCSPAPPAPIVGYATSRGIVSIHRRECNVVRRASSAARLLDARWEYGANRGGTAVFRFALSDPRGVAAVVRALNGSGVQVVAVEGPAANDGEGGCELTVQYANPRSLKKVTVVLKRAGARAVAFDPI